VRIALLGVRGSTPATGHEFADVGGDTSCVTIGIGDEAPRLVLDAGTGLRRLSDRLAGGAFAGTILLSHLHWDHLQGLPFFASGDRDDAEVTLLLPDQGDPLAVLQRGMSPPHFPIGPEGLRGRWRFGGLAEGRHRIEGLDVTARAVAHKGGLAYGYRVSDGTSSVAYLPDHALTLDEHGAPTAAGELDGLPPDVALANALELADGVDVLIHDAQFVESERAVAIAYGHATVEAAVVLAERAGARRLVLFHHGPNRRDAEVDALGARAGDLVARPEHADATPLEIEVGTQSTVIDLPTAVRGESRPAPTTSTS
jgi:phosphoribosyl 1,2-cyclic phosphodiesterase